jgi:hypothetical protein
VLPLPLLHHGPIARVHMRLAPKRCSLRCCCPHKLIVDPKDACAILGALGAPPAGLCMPPERLRVANAHAPGKAADWREEALLDLVSLEVMLLEVPHYLPDHVLGVDIGGRRHLRLRDYSSRRRRALAVLLLPVPALCLRPSGCFLGIVLAVYRLQRWVAGVNVRGAAGVGPPGKGPFEAVPTLLICSLGLKLPPSPSKGLTRCT